MIRKSNFSFFLLVLMPVTGAAQELGLPIKNSAQFETIPNLRKIALSNDNKWIALSGERGQLEIWNIRKQTRRCSMAGPERAILQMQFINADTELAIVTIQRDGAKRVQKISTWDVSSGRRNSEIDLEGTFRRMSQDARLVIAPPAPKSNIVHVLDLINKKKITLEAEEWCFGWFICPQNRTIVTHHLNGIHIWDFPTGKLRHKLASKKNETHRRPTSFSADGKKLHLTDHRSEIIIMDAFSGDRLPTGRIQGGEFSSLFPDGKHFFQGTGTILNLETRKPIYKLTAEPTPTNDEPFLALSNDGRMLATRATTGRIYVWDIPDLNPRKK